MKLKPVTTTTKIPVLLSTLWGSCCRLLLTRLRQPLPLSSRNAMKRVTQSRMVLGFIPRSCIK
ncbi:hypothetical protein DL95DRAFT_389326, partial [Leptodontidium sp. 2 PMI_412]